MSLTSVVTRLSSAGILSDDLITNITAESRVENSENFIRICESYGQLYIAAVFYSQQPLAQFFVPFHVCD